MTIARWPSGQATDSESVQTGSTPVRAANLAPWRNRNAAVCKTAMSRGSTGRGFQHAGTAGVGELAERQGNAVLTRRDPLGRAGSIPAPSATRA